MEDIEDLIKKDFSLNPSTIDVNSYLKRFNLKKIDLIRIYNDMDEPNYELKKKATE